MGTANEGFSTYKIAGVACLGVALLFHLISISAPNWAYSNPDKTDRIDHIGLWKFCTYPIGGGDRCDDFIDIIYGDWLKACQSFMVLALFTLPAALGLFALITFVPGFENNMMVVGMALGVTGVSGLFMLIVIGSWGAMFQEYFNTKEPQWQKEGDIGVLSWAYGLAVVEMILTFAAVVLGALGV